MNSSRVTVDGHTITCDAYGCHTVSLLETATVVSVEYLRLRFALMGWQMGGDEGQLDFCPRHSRQRARDGEEK